MDRSRTTSAATLRLRLIATSDMHANLRPYDYLEGRERPGSGLAVLATRIEELRAEEDNVLLFDNGDTIEGSPMAELAAAENRRPNPMIRAMNAIGYDAATLGNHDFNYGLVPLANAIDEADHTIVTTNLSRVGGASIGQRSTVLVRTLTDENGQEHELRIGVVGVAPPQLVDWDWTHLQGKLRAAPIVSAAGTELRRLLEAEGADLTIALCHSGIDQNAPADGGENAVIRLAETGLPDVIIAGHTHELFPGHDVPDENDVDNASGTVRDVPVVQPGFGASHVGVIDLGLARDGQGRWRIRDSHSFVVSGADAPGSPAILRLTDADHARTIDTLSRRIGHSEVPLVSYFSQVGPCHIMTLISEAQANAAKRLMDGHPAAGLPMLSAVNPIRTGGPTVAGAYTDIPPGPLELRHGFDLYSFVNRLVVMKLSGASLRRWLEYAARCYHRIEPGKPDQCLIDHSIPGYGYDIIFGVTYRIDVTQPRLDWDPSGPGRIRELKFQGRPVRDDDSFLMASNSYRSGGGSGYTSFAEADTVLSTDLMVRDIIVAEIEQRGVLQFTNESTWGLDPAGGTEVVVGTGIGAMKHPDLYTPLGLRPLPQDGSGAAKFGLTL